MSWFELVGAYVENLHTVGLILAILSTIVTIVTSVAAIASSEEYNEIEFLSIAKTFGFIMTIMWVLACAPTPKTMQDFSKKINPPLVSITEENLNWAISDVEYAITESIRALPEDSKWT